MLHIGNSSSSDYRLRFINAGERTHVINSNTGNGDNHIHLIDEVTGNYVDTATGGTIGLTNILTDVTNSWITGNMHLPNSKIFNDCPSLFINAIVDGSAFISTGDFDE